MKDLIELILFAVFAGIIIILLSCLVLFGLTLCSFVDISFSFQNVIGIGILILSITLTKSLEL